jgi:3-hydroxybutyrate dehydrogenase
LYAASGIGRAIAERLRAGGAHVVLVDLPGDRLDAAAAAVGGEAAGVDLLSREEVHRLVSGTGQVDVLVNNAGIQHVSPVEDFPDAAWDRILAVMLTAPFLLAKGVLPGMYASGWGRIINVASVHGLVASPYKAAYVAAKHGLLGLTKTLALEASARCPDVTAHAVCPSYVRTPLVEAQIADQARIHGIGEDEVVGRVLLEANAVKRMIEPADVAELVASLCGPAAWTMTGAAIPMDAGWLAH